MLEVCKEGEMPASNSSLNSVTEFTIKQRLFQLVDMFKFLQLFTPMAIFFYFLFKFILCILTTWMCVHHMGTL